MENLLRLGFVMSTPSSILEVSLDPCLNGFNFPRVFDMDEKKVGFLGPWLFDVDEEDDDVLPLTATLPLPFCKSDM